MQKLKSWNLMGVENSLLKIRSESGKLFFFGCCFPPKSRNFGTLRDWRDCDCDVTLPRAQFCQTPAKNPHVRWKFPAHDQKGAKLVLQQPALFLGERGLTWERHRGQFNWKPLGDSTGERQRDANSFQRGAAHQAGAEGMDSDFAGCALHWYPACRKSFANTSQIMGDA